jgi:hypothetical protein
VKGNSFEGVTRLARSAVFRGRIRVIRKCSPTHAAAGTSRRVPPQLEQLEWAKEYVDWTDEQWDGILWSDETWAQPGRHTKIWVTRKIGEEEVYYKDCV